jgi:hypothetical protein
MTPRDSGPHIVDAESSEHLCTGKLFASSRSRPISTHCIDQRCAATGVERHVRRSGLRGVAGTRSVCSGHGALGCIPCGAHTRRLDSDACIQGSGIRRPLRRHRHTEGERATATGADHSGLWDVRPPRSAAVLPGNTSPRGRSSTPNGRVSPSTTSLPTPASPRPRASCLRTASTVTPPTCRWQISPRVRRWSR